MKRGLTFTIYHGFIGSLAIHAALAAPFVLPRWTEVRDEPQPLVIELKGVDATSQSEEKVLQQTKGEEANRNTGATKFREVAQARRRKPKDKPEEVPEAQPPQPEEQKSEEIAQAQPPQPQEKEPDEVAQPLPPQSEEKKSEEVAQQSPRPEEQKPVEKKVERPSPPVPEQRPAKASTGGAGSNNVAGTTEQQQGQTIQAVPPTDRDLLRNYVTLLSKKVQTNLVYPEDARDARLQGAPVVSFTIREDGQIRSETLKIATSSGKPKLDAAALKTITASAPFDPPPREVSVVMGVQFGNIGKK